STFALAQLYRRDQALDGYGWMGAVLAIALFVAVACASARVALLHQLQTHVQDLDYSRRHLVLLLVAPIVLGAFTAYAGCVMAGAAAIIAGGIAGAVATPIAGLWCRTGALPGAIGLGVALGAMVSCFRGVPRVRRGSWDPDNRSTYLRLAVAAG